MTATFEPIRQLEPIRQPSATTVGTEVITPQVAKDLLLNNKANRRIEPKVVAKYARDMAEGLWGFDASAIIIASDGSLLNGQHRLSAVVESGATVVFTIARGVDVREGVNFDRHRARSNTASLKFMGLNVSGKEVAALSKITQYESGERIYQAGPLAVSAGKICETVENNRLAVSVANFASKVRTRGFNSATALAAYVLIALGSDERAVFDFWNLAMAGEGFKGDPAFTLHRRVTAPSINRRPNYVQSFVLFGRAYQSHAAGERLFVAKGTGWTSIQKDEVEALKARW